MNIQNSWKQCSWDFTDLSAHLAPVWPHTCYFWIQKWTFFAQITQYSAISRV